MLFPVSLVIYPVLCRALTHDDSLAFGDDDLLCSLVTVTSGSLCPFVSCGLGRPVPSRLALDDAIRHKPLNMSSRFSPRVAGENDFLQTVINKVIAAKEVNHKGQGMYSFVLFLHMFSYYMNLRQCCMVCILV